MQSVTYSFRNITALSIIDIINQLLRATESGREMYESHIVHLVGPPSSSETSRGHFPDERTTEMVEGMASYQAPINVITVNYT